MTGPVESTNKAELLVPVPSGAVPGPVEIEELGRGYWEFVARRSLGIFRATED